MAYVINNDMHEFIALFSMVTNTIKTSYNVPVIVQYKTLPVKLWIITEIRQVFSPIFTISYANKLQYAKVSFRQTFYSPYSPKFFTIR